MLCDSSSFRVKSKNYSEERCVLIQAGLSFIRQKQFTSGQVNIHPQLNVSSPVYNVSTKRM